MKKLVFILALSACGRHAPAASPSDLAAVQAQRDAFLAGFSPESVERCDRITFTALAKTAGWPGSLAPFEEPAGKWNRDASPCFINGVDVGSDSECSLDGYLSVLHTADAAAARRMLDYLEPRGWICGEGPKSVTSIAKLEYMVRRIAQSPALIGEPVLGFQGHLLASYLWLKRKVEGSNNVAEKTALWTLYQDNPASPFFAALAGKTDEAIDILMRHFPEPYSQFWGSAPSGVIYSISTQIVEENLR